MLRHGCGYALANAGHDTRALQAWLGHKNIQHTVSHTELELSPNFGDGRRVQAAAVWDREDAGLTATSIPSVNVTP